MIPNPVSFKPIHASERRLSPPLNKATYPNCPGRHTVSTKLCSVPVSRCFHSKGRLLADARAPTIIDVQACVSCGSAMDTTNALTTRVVRKNVVLIFVYM